MQGYLGRARIKSKPAPIVPEHEVVSPRVLFGMATAIIAFGIAREDLTQKGLSIRGFAGPQAQSVFDQIASERIIHCFRLGPRKVLFAKRAPSLANSTSLQFSYLVTRLGSSVCIYL